MSNLFLFPSLYDTNGLVVKEAAACECPSLLIKGSCASETVEDNFNGILIENTLEDFSNTLKEMYFKKDQLKTMGHMASQTLFLSWERAVENAYKGYEAILLNAKTKRKRA